MIGFLIFIVAVFEDSSIEKSDVFLHFVFTSFQWIDDKSIDFLSGV